MGPEVSSLSLALLFLATSVSQAQSQAVPPSDVVFDVGRSFTLNCTLPKPPEPGTTFEWMKNGTLVSALAELTGRTESSAAEDGARLTVRRALEDDFGNYSCSAGGQAVSAWTVRAKPVARLPAHTNVVEGQKLKLVCRVVGKPYPPVSWTFYNGSDANGTDVRTALGERVTLQPSEWSVPDAELVVEGAERTDAGVYRCSPAEGVLAETTLLVKDKYAALWPFLGICAEVVVLCAVILVYERRRTKPEMDDSDTDNHDQKKS